MIRFGKVLAARSALVLSLFFGLPGCASAARPSVIVETTVHAKPSDAHHVYRLDYVVKASEGGDGKQGERPSSVSAYMLALEEHHSGEIRTGSNVPLQRGPGPSARLDVGMVLRSSYELVGDDLLLHVSAETSSTDEPSIRKIAVHGDALVPVGRATLVGSVDDPNGHVKYLIEVTATKLR